MRRHCHVRSHVGPTSIALCSWTLGIMEPMMQFRATRQLSQGNHIQGLYDVARRSAMTAFAAHGLGVANRGTRPHLVCSVVLGRSAVVGAARDRVDEGVLRFIASLQHDPTLDVVATVTLLGCELVLRFGQYRDWQFAIWRLCRAFHLEGYPSACFDFLHWPKDALDAGLGLPVRVAAAKADASEQL